MNPNFNTQPDDLVSPPNPPSEPSGFSERAPRALRTFEEDIADAVRDGKGSVLGIALAEQKRKDESISFSKAKKSNTWLLFFGFLFLVAAIGILSYLGYIKYKDQLGLPGSAISKNITVDSPVSSDKNLSIDIDKLLPKNGISRSLLYTSGGSDLSTRTLQIINPTLVSGGVVTLADNKTILSRIAPHAPSILSRSIAGNITLGIYAGDTAIPFIILKANSYEGLFSGLLEWEEFMSDDLFILMGVTVPSNTVEIPAVSAPTEILTASSTATTSQPNTVTNAQTVASSDLRDATKFIDRTIKNKDVRVLQDANAKIYFMYGFADKDTVIITTSSEAFFEVAARLR